MKKLNEKEFPFKYTGNLTWLQDRTIYLVKHGSKAYGTNTETSDDDFKGIAIPPMQYYLGIQHNFEQAEMKAPNPDAVIYHIQKFMALAVDCNPTLLEVLFLDSSDHIIVTPLAEKILEKRDIFLSKAVRYRFGGFAFQQLKRIETHRKWLLNPPKAPPVREDFDLPAKPEIKSEQLLAIQSLLDKKLNNWVLDFGDIGKTAEIAIKEKISEVMLELKITSDEAWAASARTIGCSENFIRMIQKEKEYAGALKEWDNYQCWKKERNPDRAKLEAEYGYDSKHAYHLVRLTRMAKEILTTGKVIVKRPDREELLAIRNGAWSYDVLIEWATKAFQELDVLYKEYNIIPDSGDRKAVDKLCQQIELAAWD